MLSPLLLTGALLCLSQVRSALFGEHRVFGAAAAARLEPCEQRQLQPAERLCLLQTRLMDPVQGDGGVI